jgi:hypothetical protein
MLVSVANGQLFDGLSPAQFCFWERLPSTYLGMPTEHLFKFGGIVAMTIFAITLATATVTTALGDDADVTQHVGPLFCDLPMRPYSFVMVERLER